MLDYKFTKDLEHLINHHCIETGSNTPDFMLAEYLIRCIDNYNQICRQRDAWYSVPGNSYFEKKDEERRKTVAAKPAVQQLTSKICPVCGCSSPRSEGGGIYHCRRNITCGWRGILSPVA